MRSFLICSLLLVASAGSAVPLETGGLTRKVLLIGLDGVRPDALEAAATPALDALRANGAYTGRAMSSDLSSSGPGWTSILTGVTPSLHGVLDNSFQDTRVDEYPTLFRRAEAHDPDLVTASITHWIPLSFLNFPDVDFLASGSDPVVAATAAQQLAGADPDLMFLHFDDVDAAGHAFGYSPVIPEYLTAIETVDALVGSVMDALVSRATFLDEDWLVLVTTDHGGTGTSHGGPSPEEKTVFLIASGPSARRGEIADPVFHWDVAPTALTHLGVPIDPAWGLEGRVVGLVPEPHVAFLLASSFAVACLRRLAATRARGRRPTLAD